MTTYTEDILAAIAKAIEDVDRHYTVVPGREHYWVLLELHLIREKLHEQQRREMAARTVCA